MPRLHDAMAQRGECDQQRTRKPGQRRIRAFDEDAAVSGRRRRTREVEPVRGRASSHDQPRSAAWQRSVLDRISVDPVVRFGKPCVRGTRITVGDVLGYLAGGMSEAQVVTQFPQLTPDDIKACLAYAAGRERRTSGTPVG